MFVFSIFVFVLHFHRLPLQWENVQNQHTRLNIFGIQFKEVKYPLSIYPYPYIHVNLEKSVAH